MTKFTSAVLFMALLLITACSKPAVYEVPDTDSTNPTTAEGIAEGEPNPDTDENGPDEDDAIAEPTPSDEPTQEPAAETSGALQLSMTSTNFVYTPNVISAQVGQEVVITMTNTGTHDFVIDELGVRQALAAGVNTIRFTPSKAGTFEFYCSIGSHREMGMKGTITVK